MFGEARPLVYMRSSDVNKSAPRIEGVTPHNFAYSKYSLIEWCFTPLLTVFQSYHGDRSHYSCLSWVSSVLDWGSEVSWAR